MTSTVTPFSVSPTLIEVPLDEVSVFSERVTLGVNELNRYLARGPRFSYCTSASSLALKPKVGPSMIHVEVAGYRLASLVGASCSFGVSHRKDEDAGKLFVTGLVLDDDSYLTKNEVRDGDLLAVASSYPSSVNCLVTRIMLVRVRYKHGEPEQVVEKVFFVHSSADREGADIFYPSKTLDYYTSHGFTPGKRSNADMALDSLDMANHAYAVGYTRQRHYHKRPYFSSMRVTSDRPDGPEADDLADWLQDCAFLLAYGADLTRVYGTCWGNNSNRIGSRASVLFSEQLGKLHALSRDRKGTAATLAFLHPDAVADALEARLSGGLVSPAVQRALSRAGVKDTATIGDFIPWATELYRLEKTKETESVLRLAGLCLNLLAVKFSLAYNYHNVVNNVWEELDALVEEELHTITF
jgi:hypothetical protein